MKKAIQHTLKAAGSICLLLFLVQLWSCQGNGNMPDEQIELLNASINGSNLYDTPQLSSGSAEILLSFSKAVNMDDLRDVLEIEPAVELEFTGLNQNTRVRINTELAPDITYSLQLSKGAFAADGSGLREAISLSFSTARDAVSVCSNASGACQDTIFISSAGAEATFPYYSSLPFARENAAFEEVEMAMIVIHGVNRNAGEYFNFVLSPLLEEELGEKILVVAPEFAEDAQGNRLYWTSRGWREGQVSSGPLSVSSFSIIDSLARQILRGDKFPNLKKLVVTGHSSGGLFTHVYGAANSVESQNPEVSFEYIIANSQYFYYPDGRRVQGSGGNKSLFIPQDCSGYDFWPFGYRFVPAYLDQTTAETYNNRFRNRSLIYLLGDLDDADPSLNTTDCYANLLGPTRYERGRNMYAYMELAYGTEHEQREITVPGVGHDASGMYRSEKFKELVREMLGE